MKNYVTISSKFPIFPFKISILLVLYPIATTTQRKYWMKRFTLRDTDDVTLRLLINKSKWQKKIELNWKERNVKVSPWGLFYPSVFDRTDIRVGLRTVSTLARLQTQWHQNWSRKTPKTSYTTVANDCHILQSFPLSLFLLPLFLLPLFLLPLFLPLSLSLFS